MPHFYECFQDWERAGDPHYPPRFFDSYYKHHDDLRDVKRKKPDESLARSKKPADRDEYFRQYLGILLDLNLTQEVTIDAIGVWDTVGALGAYADACSPWILYQTVANPSTRHLQAYL